MIILYFAMRHLCEILTKFQNELVKIIGKSVNLLFHNVVICLRNSHITFVFTFLFCEIHKRKKLSKSFFEMSVPCFSK